MMKGMSVLKRESGGIYYEVHGSGPAVLMTHGYSATSQMWDGQVELLSADHTLIIWDMVGHGQSASPTDAATYASDEAVEIMAELLDINGFENAVIGGLSLGGYLSLAFHRAYPERTNALLIIDTGPGFKSDEARAEWNTYALEFGDGFLNEGLGVLAARSPEMASARHNSVDGLVMAAKYSLTQHHPQVIESLPTIGVPSIVIVGANDEPFLNAANYMEVKIPGTTKVVIADAGHAVNIDQPAEFNRVISQFLTTHGL